MDFDGKTYIVTGGASGIGFAVVKKLLSLGASVHIIDLSAKVPEIDIKHTGGLHFHSNVDVGSREEVSRTFETIIQRSPELHGLVNCAGIAPPKKDDLNLPESDEQFHRIMRVNLTGTWNTATAYFWHLLKKYPDLMGDTTEMSPREGLGSVVNIASIAALNPGAGMAAYNTSKSGVIALTRTWAKEYVKRGVRVNCVAPGAVATPMTMNGQFSQAVKTRLFDRMPLGRMAKPEEIANSIAFLLSDQASYITGQVLPVEGATI